MTAERKELLAGAAGIERRVRLHAALAEPLRLRIIDALTLGDASSTDLQTLLGISSNLLAHHLRILEQVELVTRHRSQADRRRSYLQLLPAALDELLPRPAALAHSVPRVVFVCTANSARSQLAAALWQATSDIPATSAGTHPASSIAPAAADAARRHGLRLPQTGPQPLEAVLAGDDYLVTVCDNAHEELTRAGGRPPTRPMTGRSATEKRDRPGVVARLHWSVPDPVPIGTAAAFDAAIEDLGRRVTHLAPRLSARHAAS